MAITIHDVDLATDPVAKIQRETAAATTGPMRIRPFPVWVGPRHRSREELEHLFPNAPPPAPVVYTEVRCIGRGCPAHLSGRWSDPPRALEAHGWTRAPLSGIRIDLGAGRFHAVYRVLQVAVDGLLHPAQLTIIPPSEVAPRRPGTLWLLGLPAKISIDTLLTQLGVTWAETPLPEILAGQWACGRGCISTRLQAETIGSREVLTTKDAPQARAPESPSQDVRCSARGCVNVTPGVPRAKFADPTQRAKVAQDFGLFLNPDGRVFCSRTCAELSAMVEGRPVPAPVTREQLIAKYGARFVPESFAEKVYREAHGHGPSEPAQAPEEPATPKPRRPAK
jgi:hypothetical protein